MTSNILYPNVTSLPGQTGVNPADRQPAKRPGGAPSEFDQVFDQLTTKVPGEKPGAGPATPGGSGLSTDLSQIRQPLKFSAHASQRLKERKIQMDPATLAKVNDAIDKAEAKGVEESLVLTKDAALIVSVKNRTVITAMDRGSMAGNVFTNIDGAVVI